MPRKKTVKNDANKNVEDDSNKEVNESKPTQPVKKATSKKPTVNNSNKKCDCNCDCTKRLDGLVKKLSSLGGSWERLLKNI